MKKTRNYGLIGILLAALLVAMIYSYGVTPGISPKPSPSTQTDVSPMRTFDSYDDLRSFLSASGTNNGDSYYQATQESSGTFVLKPSAPPPVPSAIPSAVPSAERSTADFSKTNIQVAGVDEADTVKTDGKHLYVIANNSQTVYVLDVDPQNAKILSKISFSNVWISGIFLSEDGSKLALFGNKFVPYYVDREGSKDYATGLVLPYWNSGSTFVYIYDVSIKASPVLARNFTMSGNYVNSRMIGDYLYGIITESAYVVDTTVILPTVFAGPQASNVAPTKIYYADTTDSYYSYTTISSINIKDDLEQPSILTLMMGGAGTIYVSSSNIYVTYPGVEYETMMQPTISATSILADKNSPETITVFPIMPTMMIPVWQGTNIYRIQVSGSSLTFAARGNVTGNVLNQYAMDEYDGYFRIATNSYDYVADSWKSTKQNNVYVLDTSLNIVGKLENLATGENFHSARFIGNRLYMVTFQNTDPLFVIDLSHPSDPSVLGELIIPGYSDYLHPYDENHLIGLGKDAVVEEGINFAWYQGLKLSLFDVSNVKAPQEVAKIIIGDRGTSSEALYDPKAFLFDPTRRMLVIPVNLYLVSQTSDAQQEKQSVPTINGTDAVFPIAPSIIGWGSSSSQYGTFVWQGAYIFEVTANEGFVLEGNVTQLDNAAELWSDPTAPVRSEYGWRDYNHFITRTLYIDNVLYTFSQSRVQLNSLDDFAVLAKIDLN